MRVFTKTILLTGPDGRAGFREETIPLDQGKPEALLTQVFASGGYQLRESPVGFQSSTHCTPQPQWVFILQGEMVIGVNGAPARTFKAGQHFYSADLLPEGATFDPAVHGHWSAQAGPEPLVTLFLRG